MAVDVVVVSNRGPLSFSVDGHGRLVSRRGAGGLAGGLGPLVQGTGATWVAAALSEGDRRAAANGVVEEDGYRLRSLVLDDEDHRLAYDVVSNDVLWFLHHNLFDLPRRPSFGREFRAAWDAYRRVNEAFAEAVCDEAAPGATVLVQDYHLALVGSTVAKARPDLVTAHFSHTPFCTPDALRVLPDDIAVELLEGMAANGACGFHSQRWATAFEACCATVLGQAPPTFVAPLAPDPDDLAAVAASPECERELAWLDERVRGRKLLVRVDRVELSKNILRGFEAYDELLLAEPQWRGEVVFGAFIYPSREGLDAYVDYHRDTVALVDAINDRWGTSSWQPIVLDSEDNFPRSVAALRRYDALLVNPIRDGLNLVAKEGPLLNERDGLVVLSREAGAWDELGDAAIGINPFDVAATADALHHALSMAPEPRAARSAALHRLASARTPRDWLDDQLRAAAPSAG